MVEPPCAFEEMHHEAFFSNTPQFGHPELHVTPEALKTIDMVLPPNKFILVVVDTVVPVAFPYQAVIGLPPVRVDGAFFKHLPLDNGKQSLAATVFDDLDINLALPFQ